MHRIKNKNIMTTVETISFGLIATFIFLGIVLSIFPRNRQKQEYPKYRRSERRYLPRTKHYIKRKED